jgi:hypothetical protein
MRKLVYSWEERVFILEHYFTSKSFAAVCEAFNNVYRDKEVPSKTVHLLVTKFREAGNACLRQALIEQQLKLRWYRSEADHQQDTAVIIRYNIVTGFVAVCMPLFMSAFRFKWNICISNFPMRGICSTRSPSFGHLNVVLSLLLLLQTIHWCATVPCAGMANGYKTYVKKKMKSW